MKKSLLFILLGIFTLTSVLLVAAENKQSEEEYDEDIYGPEAPIVWEKPVRGVIFSHKTHTMVAELDCDECHDDLFEMEAGAAEEDENFNMAAMYEGESCGMCHDGDYAFAADTRCTLCHIGVRGVARLEGGEQAEKSSH